MVIQISKKILSWIPQEELDHQTLGQLYNIAKLPSYIATLRSCQTLIWGRVRV